MAGLKGLIVAVFIFLSLNNYAQKSKNYLERKAVSMVENLKEVKEAKMYFKKTGSPLHVFFDGINGKDFYVRVAQTKGDMTFTQYWFLVNPTKNTIKYWDVGSNTSVSISQWRRNNHKIVSTERKQAN